MRENITLKIQIQTQIKRQRKRKRLTIRNLKFGANEREIFTF